MLQIVSQDWRKSILLDQGGPRGKFVQQVGTSVKAKP